MDALSIQHMVRGQEESRSQESKEALVLPLAMPQEHRRFSFAERLEVLPQELGLDDVCFEEGPVGRPRACEVIGQLFGCSLSDDLVGAQELRGQPWRPEGVVSDEGHM